MCVFYCIVGFCGSVGWLVWNQDEKPVEKCVYEQKLKDRLYKLIMSWNKMKPRVKHQGDEQPASQPADPSNMAKAIIHYALIFLNRKNPTDIVYACESETNWKFMYAIEGN